MIKMWLDDVRDAPAGWTHVHTYAQAVDFMLLNKIDVASLDHDLINYDPDDDDMRVYPADYDHNGMDLVWWIKDHNMWPDALIVHSGNPFGAADMCAVIQKYGMYTDKRLITHDDGLTTPGVMYYV